MCHLCVCYAQGAPAWGWLEQLPWHSGWCGEDIELLRISSIRAQCHLPRSKMLATHTHTNCIMTWFFIMWRKLNWVVTFANLPITARLNGNLYPVEQSIKIPGGILSVATILVTGLHEHLPKECFSCMFYLITLWWWYNESRSILSPLSSTDLFCSTYMHPMCW